MMDMTLLVLIACTNGVLSFALFRSGQFTGSENAAQMILLWMIPVLGAALVLAFLRSQRQADTALVYAAPALEVAPVQDSGAADSRGQTARPEHG